MRTRREVFSTALTFGASSTKSLAVGNLGFWCTGFAMQYLFTFDTGSAVTNSQEALFRGLTSFQISSEGKPVIAIGAPDTRVWYWATRGRLSGGARCSDEVTTTSQAALDLRYTMPVVFGVNPLLPNGHINYYDTTAAIRPSNDLTIQVTWGAAGSTTSDSAWGHNIGSETGTQLLFTFFGVMPVTADETPKYRPNWTTTQYSPTQTYSNLGGQVQLSTPMYYRRSTLVYVNGATTAPPADNRLDGLNSDAISEVALRRGADGSNVFYHKVVDLSQLSQSKFPLGDDNGALAQSDSQGATLAKMAAVASSPWNPGVNYVDYAQVGEAGQVNPLYGANLMGTAINALSYQFTVDAATNTSVLLMHEGYLPY